MKKNNVLILIFVVVLLFVFIVGVLLPKSSPSSPLDQLPLSVPPAPTIGITQPTNAVFAFASLPNIPAELPSFMFFDFSDNELITRLTGILPLYELPASPSSLLRAGVTTTTWSREGAELTLHKSNASTVTFHQSTAKNLPQTNPGPEAVAEAFVSGLFPSSRGVSLIPSGVTTGVSEGLLITDRFGSSLFTGVLYSFAAGGYPIVSYPYTSTTSFVIVDNLGIVRSSTIHPPPKTLIEADHVQIIQPEDILVNLSSGRGSIISAGRASDSDFSGTVAFTRFSIDKVTIVYARNGETLLPAFILHGSGTAADGKMQEAEFFLWAYSEVLPTSSP